MGKGDLGLTHTLLLFALILKSVLELWLETGALSVMHSACIVCVLSLARKV